MDSPQPPSRLHRSFRSRRSHHGSQARVSTCPDSWDIAVLYGSPFCQELRHVCIILISLVSDININISPLSTFFSVFPRYPLMLINLQLPALEEKNLVGPSQPTTYIEIELIDRIFPLPDIKLIYLTCLPCCCKGSNTSLRRCQLTKYSNGLPGLINTVQAVETPGKKNFRKRQIWISEIEYYQKMSSHAPI